MVLRATQWRITGDFLRGLVLGAVPPGHSTTSSENHGQNFVVVVVRFNNEAGPIRTERGSAGSSIVNFLTTE
jgi:hypothetical protein